jgi:pyruvate kinase
MWLIPAIEGLGEHLSIGQRVFLDDGIARAVVREAREGRTDMSLEFTESQKVKIKVDSGIQIPRITEDMKALTETDVSNLERVIHDADIIGLSFVNTPNDVAQLRGILESYNNPTGMVVKLETAHSFDYLPNILFELMKYPDVGLMIARGDLGLSVGFDRLSEIQEEILWLCEAAHIPVIWATQVLEKLVKKGLATRPEITDAAMSTRAECVMLNKGRYQDDALRSLSSIRSRMHGHFHKKKLNMRPLHLAQKFLE